MMDVIACVILKFVEIMLSNLDYEKSVMMETQTIMMDVVNFVLSSLVEMLSFRPERCVMMEIQVMEMDVMLLVL